MKSLFLAGALAFFLGPLGLLYVSVGWSFAYFVLGILAPLTFLIHPLLGLGLVVAVWFFGIVCAVDLARVHNENFIAYLRSDLRPPETR